MEKHEFYAKYADTPITKRLELISNRYNDTLLGKCLEDVYLEIKEIDNKLRDDEIRREKLLDEASFHLNKVTLTPNPS